MIKAEVPILEFDSAEGIISPSDMNKNNIIFPELLVITFFKEGIIKLLEEHKIKEYYLITGENDIQVYKFVDKEIILIHGKIGCPACGGALEELIAFGVKKVMFCGGGGVLKPEITKGHMMIVDGAIRDDGFSYHYFEPSRIIEAQSEVNDIIAKYLDERKLDYFRGIVWTTDALFRETKEKIKCRKEEGAVIVEMEQSGCIAVAKFRNIKYGALIYGGDDVSGDKWDYRDWHNQTEVRYNLILICKDILTLI